MKKLCKNCGKDERRHKAVTGNCPFGMKTRVGYTSFCPDRVFEPKLKTAQLQIAMVEFICPTCGEYVSSDTGSHLFPIAEIPEVITCDFCKVDLRVPAKALKIKRGLE